MTTVDARVQKIIDWRESFITLPDNHFFEIIRMYLGEIHSPFNKQKLVEQLGAFLRQEKNRHTIVNLLSEGDLLILAAVYYIPGATNEKLSAFFSGSMNFASLYERLLNLEERLLIYRHKDKLTSKTIFDINPTLEDVILPLINKNILLPEPQLAEKNDYINSALTPEKIAAFVSFINETPGLCKADGLIKKRDGERLELIFGRGTLPFFQFLMNAFVNLSLVKECNAGWQINRVRFAAFAELKDKLQYAYLCVASQGAFSRTGLVSQAKLLLSVLDSIPASGYTKTSVLRSSFLINEMNSPSLERRSGLSFAATGTGRFAQMLNRAAVTEEAAATSDTSQGNSLSIIDRLWDCAEAFGLVDVYGKDLDGKNIYVKGNLLSSPDPMVLEENGGELPKVLNIDAGFNAMVFPGLPLKALLEFVVFMDLKQFDTAAIFEISKKSVMRSFDSGLNAEKIYQLIAKYCPYGLPENLKVSIEDWSSAYSSAILYKGYILKVEQEKTALVQNNPAIAPFISENLAPGIFLLSVLNDEEAELLIKNSGLDFIGSIQTAKREVSGPIYPEFDLSLVLKGRSPLDLQQMSGAELEKKLPADGMSLATTDEERKAHFDSLRQELSKMSITPEQREGLLLRINRKIILSTAQLNADSVKLEQIEASGMDFQGKVHVAESAIQQNMMLEMEFEDKKLPEGIAVIVGTPTAVEKNSLDSTVHLIVEPEHEERTFSLGQARNVKRIRGRF